MFGGHVFIFEPVCFFVGKVYHAFDARSHVHLHLTAAGKRSVTAITVLQGFVHAIAENVSVHGEVIENVLHRAAGLIEQGKQKVLGIELRVPVALDNFVRARKRILRALGESIKAHHSFSLRQYYSLNPNARQSNFCGAQQKT